MSQEPTEKEISTALEKLTITIDLQKKTGQSTETSSLFKPKVLCVIDRIKEKKRNALILTLSLITSLRRKPLLLAKFLLS